MVKHVGGEAEQPLGSRLKGVEGRRVLEIVLEKRDFPLCEVDEFSEVLLAHFISPGGVCFFDASGCIKSRKRDANSRALCSMVAMTGSFDSKEGGSLMRSFEVLNRGCCGWLFSGTSKSELSAAGGLATICFWFDSLGGGSAFFMPIPWEIKFGLAPMETAFFFS